MSSKLLDRPRYLLLWDERCDGQTAADPKSYFLSDAGRYLDLTPNMNREDPKAVYNIK